MTAGSVLAVRQAFINRFITIHHCPSASSFFFLCTPRAERGYNVLADIQIVPEGSVVARADGSFGFAGTGALLVMAHPPALTAEFSLAVRFSQTPNTNGCRFWEKVPGVGEGQTQTQKWNWVTGQRFG